MYFHEEKAIAKAFEELSKGEHRFEVMSCLELPSLKEVADADIIRCGAKTFIQQHAKIKEIISTNPKVWFSVRCSASHLVEIVKEFGVKHCSHDDRDGINEKILYLFLIKKYLDSLDVSLGAGFNPN